MVTPRKTVPVVEIPVYRTSQTKKGKEKELVPEFEWQVIGNDDTGQQISEVLPMPNITNSRGATPFSSVEEADDFQDLLDAQLRSEGAYLGIDAIRASPTPSFCGLPPSLFIRELREQALVPTPPPLPPIGYSSSPAAPATVPCSSSCTTIIDLCDEDDEIGDGDDELQELPSFDLTSDHHNDDIEEDDCSIIAAATRRGGGHTHSALSIRSRSLSNAVDTPTRAPKRGRGRGFNTR